MKAFTLRNYLVVHTWTGILAGMMLFVAFYAGALAMFAPEITHWARAEPARHGANQDSDALVATFFNTHPDAKRATLVLVSPSNSAPFMRWGDRRQPEMAELGPDGKLRSLAHSTGDAGKFADYLHRKGGLPVLLDTSEPVIGIVSLMYAVALISGVVILLPSLVKDLFVVRFGRNVKRLWLDLHNLLGIASLPFHVVMALSAAVFCLHDWIYDAQGHLIYPQGVRGVEARAQGSRPPVTLDRSTWRLPSQLIGDAAKVAPGFQATTVDYRGLGTPKASAFIAGTDDAHFKRSPREGYTTLDPATGKLVTDGMVPGQGSAMSRILISFFSLHFGSYGGEPVRVLYAVLGVMGAMLFYTGNVLWIESRTKRLRSTTPSIEQPRHVRWVAALNLGVCLGCVSGLSAALVAARWAAVSSASADWVLHGVYYAVFAGCTVYAFWRGAPRASSALLYFASIATALIPLTTIATYALADQWAGGEVWAKPYTSGLGYVDALSVVGTLLLVWMAVRTSKRASNAHTSVGLRQTKQPTLTTQDAS